MEDSTGRCAGMTTPSATTEGELQWTLGEQPQVEEPIVTPPAESKSNTPLIVGSIAVFLLLGAVIAGVIVMRNAEEEDDDDWYSEDEEDEQPVVETKAPIESSSKSLDELRTEGRSIADIEAPEERRPSLFDEFNNSPEPEIESYEVETEEDVTSLEEEVSGEVEEDDGISVDENGTEWWEDEEGVWWYREEGWEDWAVWEE